MKATIRSRARLFLLIVIESSQRYGEQRISRKSAAVAYRGIFALAPLMLIAVWVVGIFLGDSDAALNEILSSIEEFGGEALADAVSVFVESAVTQGSTAAIVGVVLLLWTTTSLFFELQNDLNDIFLVPYDYTAGAVAFVKKRWFGVLWTLGVALIAVAVWALNLVWGFFEGLFDDRGLGAVHRVIELAAPFVTLIVLPVVFGLIIRTLTQTEINKTALWIGSLFTAAFFLLAALGVRLYFSWDSTTSASQVAGAFFVLLLAAYVMASVFLLGALVTKVYHDYYETGSLDAANSVVESFSGFLKGRRNQRDPLAQAEDSQ